MCNSILFVPTYRQTFELSIFFSQSQQEIATVYNTLFKLILFLGAILFLFLCMKKNNEKHDLTFSKTVNSSSPFRVARISLAPYCTGLCTSRALYAHNEFFAR